MRLTPDKHDPNTGYADLDRGEDFDHERAKRFAIERSIRCIEVYVEGHYSRAFLVDLHAAATVRPEQLQLEPAPACTGEAHTNAHVDYCGLCMSREHRHDRSVHP